MRIKSRVNTDSLLKISGDLAYRGATLLILRVSLSLSRGEIRNGIDTTVLENKWLFM